MNASNAFLELERLESNCRTYSPFEIAVYIADDLEKDPHKRVQKGISHVRMQLKYSRDGTTVPNNVGITKLSKTICKYSPEYTGGEYKSEHTTVIYTLKRSFKPKSDGYSRKKRAPKRDFSLKYNICGQHGYDESSENGCMIFAKWVLCQQANTRLKEEEVKTNTRKYLKLQRR